MAKSNKKELSATQRKALLETLKTRFDKNMKRHKDKEWESVQKKLEGNSDKLWTLHEMERTGGEPDVVEHDKTTDEYIFCDCSAETPKDRRSLCYDREALDARKEFKPADSALDMAEAMGVELLTIVLLRRPRVPGCNQGLVQISKQAQAGKPVLKPVSEYDLPTAAGKTYSFIF